jgi:hypothetical protein
MQKTLGDEIVTLLGVSESDDRMLDLFEKLGVDKNEFERDEDDGAFWVELEEEMGLELEFSDAVPKKLKDPQYIGGQYLVDITFYENCTFFPYGLRKEDSLTIVEEKINKKANYMSAEDDSILQWIYEDIGDLGIDFKDNTYKNMEGMGVSLYENPTKISEEYILPFTR